MLSLKNIRELDDKQDNWLIVRSFTGTLPVRSVQVDVLSPSRHLFFAYRRWANEGRWNMQMFNDCYVPEFLRQMKNDREAKDVLNRLYLESRTKDISLACYCENERMCHRSIVGGLLLGAGANISCNQEYKKYWDMFKHI